MRMVYAGSLLLGTALLLSGCQDNHKTGSAAWEVPSAETASKVIAVDVTGQGTVKVTGLPQGITTLTAAETPQIVLLGADFVRQHGTVSRGGMLPHQPSKPTGPEPIVAMVEGAADAFIGQVPPVKWLPELERMDRGLTGFQHRTDGRRRDALVPYLHQGGTTGAQVSAAVIRGREPALLLKGQELELLACLDGQADVDGGRSVSCHTEWSSNGDLRKPRINAAVTVTVKPDDELLVNRKASESNMAQRMTELVHNLQLHGADPLDIGQTVRALYRGVWTHDRWRNAYSRANIRVQIRLTS